MSIRFQLDRIPPGVEIGPHRHGVETLVYVALGELVFEHGEGLERRVALGPGDVLYEAPAEFHLVRNEGSVDVLALLTSIEPDPRRPGALLRRWESDDEPVRHRGEARVVENGPIRRRILVEPGDFGTASFSVLEVEIAPGAADAWHRHPIAEHALVVLEGRGEVTVGPVRETLAPLTGIRIDAGLAHRIENTGRTVLRYHVCGTPGTDPLVDRELVEPPVGRRNA